MQIPRRLVLYMFYYSCIRKQSMLNGAILHEVKILRKPSAVSIYDYSLKNLEYTFWCFRVKKITFKYNFLKAVEILWKKSTSQYYGISYLVSVFWCRIVVCAHWCLLLLISEMKWEIDTCFSIFIIVNQLDGLKQPWYKIS